MHVDGNGVGLHTFSVDGGGGAGDGELPRFGGFDDEGEGFVLGHIPVDDAHAAGLNRPLRYMKAGEIGGCEDIDLFRILDYEFYLEIIGFAHVLAWDYGSEFHLTGDIESRQQNDPDNERNT